MLGQKTKINVGFNQTVTKASWKNVFSDKQIIFFPVGKNMFFPKLQHIYY